MEGRIARTLEKGDRCFPEPSSTLYTDLNVTTDGTTNQFAAQTVLKYVDEKMSWLQLYSGWPVFGKTRFIRLLKLHREAMSAEIEGKSERADYFWNWIVQELELLQGSPIWQAIATSLPPTSILSNAEALQERFITEVIIDTHIGFYNGWRNRKATVVKSPWVQADRAEAHNRYIQHYIQAFNLPKPLHKDLQYLIHAVGITHYTQTKAWDKALEACKKLLAQPPTRPELASHLVDLTYNWVVNGIQPPNDKTPPFVSQVAVRQIQQRIGSLQSVSYQGSLADRIRAYDYLSMAYFILGLHQGRGGDLAEGMVDAQKSLDYNPSFAPAFAALIQMKAAMVNLKTQVNQVVAQLRTRPGMYLNPEGLRLQTIAQKGESALNRYVQSNGHTSLVKEVAEVRAKGLWQLIGFEQEFDQELSDELMLGIGEVARQAGFFEATASALWADVVARRSKLEALDSEKVVTHLKTRFTKQDVPQEQPFEFVAPEPAFSPYIQVAASQEQRGYRPEGYLLFTREHVRLKAWAAAAAACVVLAAGLLINNARIASLYQANYDMAKATHDAEYGVVAATVTQQFADYHATFTAEEAVLAEQYTASRTLRDEQYDLFVAAYDRKDIPSALDAALVFLDDDSAPALKDPRRQQLITTYEQMLVDLALQPQSDREAIVHYANELERVRSS